METIAVYWESKVKVYSIIQVTELTLVRLIFPLMLTEKLGEALVPLEHTVRRFELVTQDYIDSSHSQFNLFFQQSMLKTAEGIFDKWENLMQVKPALISPVELIYLHGPHFQDRFGIVETVFSALKGGGIEVIASGCAGTTIYVATPHRQAKPASQILRETFIIPSTN